PASPRPAWARPTCPRRRCSTGSSGTCASPPSSSPTCSTPSRPRSSSTGPTRLFEDFLAETGLELEDLYRRRKGGWAGLRRLAGFDDRIAGPDDDRLGGAIGRMLHIDDLERLRFIEDVLSGDNPPSSVAAGLSDDD